MKNKIPPPTRITNFENVKISGDNNHYSNVFFQSKDAQLRVSGKGNQIIVADHCRGRVQITIFGNNNRVEIEDFVYFNNTHIFLGAPDSSCNNATLKIGEKTLFSGGGTIRLMENNSKVILAKDVLLSSGYNIWCSDTHSILDADGNAKNIGKFITIGEHVWIGQDVKIGKNVAIGSGSIIGWGSIVTSGNYPEKAIIAGNPAQVRRTGIEWSRERPNQRNNRNSII